MRKVITFVLLLALILALAVPASAAKVSEMTYEELIQLRHRVDQEIISRPEWKETIVPSGRYIVGEDIPVGSYSIKLPEGEVYANFIVFGIEYGNYKDNGGLLYNEGVSENNPLLGKVTLKSGNVVYITGSLIFAPPVSPFQF